MARVIKSSNDFFDILDGLKNNDFVTIGYVTGANLDVPKIKKKNPETNRMKSYPDYSSFKKEGYEGEIGALVKITTYNFRYYNRKSIGQKYGEYKNSVNQIRSEFGIDPVQDRESYKAGTGWSDKAPEVYVGKREDLASHSYNPQNMYGAKIEGIVYAVDTDGHIVRELQPEEVKPYLKAKREPDGVAALRKMGADEAKIKQFIDRIKELKFSYKNFESNSILWMCATVNGEKIIYINDSMNRVVDEINIRPEDFRKIARERYKLSLDMFTENRKRNIVRLTESKLKQIVNESVMKVLNESRYANRVRKINEDIDSEMQIWKERDNEQFSQILKSIDDYFSSIIAPEKDEYGLTTTPIRKLRTIYALDGNKNVIVRKLFDILTNYDMIQEPKIRRSMQILKKLAAEDNTEQK